ncbi:hypothetical protein FBQ82_02195 [Anaerolineae bacterium CFX7]|nr:hypothetical protein [Anaerolineae bacterium CFX7]
MTSKDFLDLLANFSRRPIPAATKSARHLYVWQNEIEPLRAHVPQAQLHLLDLHALCKTLDTTPSSPTLARQKLERAMADWLGREFPQDGTQAVLAVTGCDVLARYDVSLGVFSQRANESKLIVFVAPSQDTHYQPRSIPPFIQIQPHTTFLYFKSFEDAIVGG